MQNEIAVSLGEKIKQVRIAKQLTLENVAWDIARSVSTIHRIEQNEAVCDNTTLEAIKKALGIENAPLPLANLKSIKIACTVGTNLLSRGV